MWCKRARCSSVYEACIWSDLSRSWRIAVSSVTSADYDRVIAIIAAIFGFGGIAGTASGIAQVLFVGFLILAVLSLLFGRRTTV